MLNKWIPSSLKYRLFAAFIFLIIIPFSLISFYSFGKAQRVLEGKSIEQSKRQVEDMQQSMLDLLRTISKTQISINQNPLLETYLKDETPDALLLRRREIERMINSYSNSFFLSTPAVFITMADLRGNAYYTYVPESVINGQNLVRDVLEKNKRIGSKSSYYWTVESSYVSKGLTRSPRLLTLYAVLKDDRFQPYGIVRISMDHEEWFDRMTNKPSLDENFYILDAGRHLVFRSGGGVGEEDSFSPVLDSRVPLSKGNEPYAFVDRDEQAIYVSGRLSAVDWTIVQKIPFRLVYQEIYLLRESFLYTLLIVTVLFSVFTFILSDTITKPVRLLQKKMREVTRDNLKTLLPVTGLRGEMLELASSFNKMVDDLNLMIYRLKAEERQKESVRFQVLHSQMNPHFLLNTLNNLKSLALKNRDEPSFNICISLGKLLETSLNVEVDMIRLEDELDIVEAYLNIQNIRFDNRFSLVCNVDDRVYYALVPKFTLQPLVENAIIHGFSDPGQPGHLQISAALAGGKLVLEVADDGAGLERKTSRALKRRRSGIGIGNIRERLALLFKQEASLEFVSAERGTVVRLTMPLLVSKPYANGGMSGVEDDLG